MHFLLLILHWLLERLVPERRDGLTMAARADGRVQHVPTRPTLWDRWLSRPARKPARPVAARGGVRAVVRPPTVISASPPTKS